MANDKTPVRDLPGAVTFTKTIGEFDAYTFAGIIGDYYPVHIDAVYAAKQPVGLALVDRRTTGPSLKSEALHDGS